MIKKWFSPMKEIPKAAAMKLGVSSFILLILIWSFMTFSGWIRPLFLPSPSKVLETFLKLMKEGSLNRDIWDSLVRVVLGFAFAALLAVPLGLFMGCLRSIQAFFEPMISFIRYMPASAFIPLFILWIGIGESEKMTIIFFGTFFQLTLMIMDVTKNVSKDLVEISYTLGASNWQIFRKIIYPAAKPGIVDTLRITFGWAWTYLIVAEIVGASSGLGYMIMQSSRFLRPDKVIMGIVIIGLLGLMTDLLFKLFYKRAFAYLNKGGK